MITPPIENKLDPAEQMHCMEVWGGNRGVEQHFHMPGLDVWLYSRPTICWPRFASFGERETPHIFGKHSVLVTRTNDVSIIFPNT